MDGSKAFFYFISKKLLNKDNLFINIRNTNFEDCWHPKPHLYLFASMLIEALKCHREKKISSRQVGDCSIGGGGGLL